MPASRAQHAAAARAAAAQVLDPLYAYDHHGAAFMLQHVPVVDAVSPRAAGLLGGARLTIAGDGFSADASAVSVLVDAAPCAVVSAALTQLVCELGPYRSSAPSLPPRPGPCPGPNPRRCR